MKINIFKWFCHLFLCVIIYSPMNGQSIPTCDFTVPTTFSEILPISNVTCDGAITGQFHTSSEGITSHTDGQSFFLCNTTAVSLTTVQSDKFVDFLPGFDMEIFHGFEARIGDCEALCPLAGMPCNDQDPCTINDVYSSSTTCDCIGTPSPDSDNDFVCDVADQCNNFDDKLLGQLCDDGNPCTENSIYSDCDTCSGVVNAALSGVASMSSLFAPGFEAFYLNNGEIAETGASGHESPTEWVQIDLGSVMMISTIVMHNLTTQTRLENAYVMVSNTPFTESTDLSLSLSNADFVYQLDGTGRDIIGVVVNQIGRYVRVQNSGNNTQGNSVVLKELEVFVPDDSANEPIIGTICDDGNACTSNDVYTSCDTCEGVVDVVIGTSCDDGDECTTNDVYTSCDTCEGVVDIVVGTSCDDGNICTTNDVYTSCDTCEGTSIVGTACDDGDVCTTNDVYISCGICEGSQQTSDIVNINTSFNSQVVSAIPEISGLTYNDVTEEFLAISDAGQWARSFTSQSGTLFWSGFGIVDYGGNHCNSTSTDRFTDTEAITYMGSTSPSDHRYAIADERDRTIVFVDVNNSDLSISYSSSYLIFDGIDDCNNNGIEGLAYDQNENIMYFATEHSDQKIYSFEVPNTINGEKLEVGEYEILVDLRTQGLNTFSTHGLDVMPNGNIVALITNDERPPNDEDFDNGEFSRKLVEFDPCGTLLGELDLEQFAINNFDDDLANSAELEGVAVVGGNIYVIGEFGRIYGLNAAGTSLVGSTDTAESKASTLKQNPPTNSSSNLIGMTDIIGSPISVYPNPFTEQVKIEVDLVADGPMRIDVIDVSGRLVQRVADQDEARKGNHVFNVEGVNLETGFYFVRVQAGDSLETKKITKL